MQDQRKHDPFEPPGGDMMPAAIALLIHVFVLALLLVVVTSLVVRVGAVYLDLELTQRDGVLLVIKIANTIHRWWFLLFLPMLLDVALVFWLAAEPSRRWLLPMLNYLWLGGALMLTTVLFGIMVSPLFQLIFKQQ